MMSNINKSRHIVFISHGVGQMKREYAVWFHFDTRPIVETKMSAQQGKSKGA